MINLNLNLTRLGLFVKMEVQKTCHEAIQNITFRSSNKSNLLFHSHTLPCCKMPGPPGFDFDLALDHDEKLRVDL